MPIPEMPKPRESTPAALYYHLLRDGADEVEMQSRAKRMGLTIDGGTLTDSQGNVYDFNKDSVKARMTLSGRDVATMAGGTVGGIVGAGSPMPGGTYLGGVSGGMIGGSAYDAAMEFQQPSGMSFAERLSEATEDFAFEVGAAVTGRGVEAASPYARGAMDAASEAYTSIKTGAKNAVARIMNEPPVERVMHPREGIQDILDAIKAGRPEEIEVVADADVLRAAQEMGIDIPIDFASNSQSYQRVVQALRSQHAPLLNQQEQTAIEALSRETDEVMELLGREDMSYMSNNLKGMWGRQQAKYDKWAGDLYTRIGGKIPSWKGKQKITRRPLAIMELLEKKKADGPLKGIYKKLQRELDEQGSFTYSYLDDLRKDVGGGFGTTPKGRFAGTTDGNLKAVYAAATQDQQSFARAFGMDREFALAQKLMQKKFDLEKKMVDTFGKDLQGTLVRAVDAASRGIKSGDVQDINRLIELVPGKFKDRVAANALDRWLTGGKQQLGAGFVERYEVLQSQKAVRHVLYKHVPKEVQGRMDNLYTVVKGMNNALGERKNKQLAVDMVVAMDKESGFLPRLFGAGLTSAVATHTGLVGAFGVKGAAMSGLPQASIVDAADAILGSPKFHNMMVAGARGASTDAAEKALAGTPAWRKWAGMQPQEVQDAIASQGIYRYFVPPANFEGRGNVMNTDFRQL
jgi:hypothetical protein